MKPLQMKEKKIERLAVLVKCSDGKVRQVLTTDNDVEYIKALLLQLHGKAVKVIDKVLDTVDL